MFTSLRRPPGLDAGQIRGGLPIEQFKANLIFEEEAKTGNS